MDNRYIDFLEKLKELQLNGIITKDEAYLIKEEWINGSDTVKERMDLLVFKKMQESEEQDQKDKKLLKVILGALAVIGIIIVCAILIAL